MKANKIVQFLLMSVILIIAAAGGASAVQNNIFLPFLNTSNFQAPGRLDAMNNLTTNNDGTLSVLAVSGVTATVKATPGRIAKVNVISASGVIAVYDAATAGAAGATNQVAAIPATVGIYSLNFPMASGVTVNPNGGVVSISYQ